MSYQNNLLDNLIQSQNNFSNNTLAIKYSGNKVASSSFISGEIFVWDMLSGNLLFIFQNDETTYCFAFSPDCTILLSGGMWGKIRQWNLIDGGPVNEVYGHNGSIVGLEYLPNGNKIISAGVDRYIKIWDNNLNLLNILENNFHISFLYISPDSENIAISGWNNTINIWNINTKNKVEIFDKTQSVKIIFSPNSKYLVSRQYYNIIKIWKLDENKEQINKPYKKYKVNENGILRWNKYMINTESEIVIKKVLKDLPEDIVNTILEKIKNSYCLEYNNKVLFDE